MTVSSQESEVTFPAGAGTVKPLPFRFFNNSEIFAWRINNTTGESTPLILGADYTLAGAGEPEIDGNAQSVMTLASPIASGFSVYVQRTLPEEQQTDIINQGKFFPEIHENVFDRLVMLIQQIGRIANQALRPGVGGFFWDALGRPIRNVGAPTQDSDAVTKEYSDDQSQGVINYADAQINRTLRTPAGETFTQFPAAALRANKFISFDAGGNWQLTAGDGTAQNLELRLRDQITEDSDHGAGLVGYHGRSASARLADVFSATDYPADGTKLAAAVASGPFVQVPNGSPSITLPGVYSALLDYLGPNTRMNVYQQSGETTRFAKRLFRGQTSSAAHMGVEYSVLGIEGVCTGSGGSGPTNADYGITLSLQKKNFDTTSVVGEIDGMNIVVRNGGPNSDTTCWLGNVSHYGQGFTAVFEANASNAVSNVTEHSVQIQAGIINNRENNYIGYFTSANTGTLDDAFRCDNLPGGSWTNFFRGIRDGVERFRVSSGGNIFMRGATGGQKMVGVLDGRFRVVNDAGTQEVFAVDDAGNGTVFGSLSGNSLRVGGVQVVGPKDTGWAAMTGVGNKNTIYDTSTITLQQLATRVNSIQAALTAHGLIGA